MYIVTGVLSAITYGGTAKALEPSTRISQYAHDAWTSRDGLPEGGVLSLLEADDGYLWIGSQCCLLRYDGTHFLAFRSGTRGLGQYTFVTNLLQTKNGDIWAATMGGLARYRAGTFEWFDENSGINHPFIYGLASDQNSIYAGTGGSGIWKLEGKRYVPLPAPVTPDSTSENLPKNIAKLAIDAKGKLWAATDQGLLEYGSSLKLYNESNGLPSSVANVIFAESSGQLWVGTRRGLARREPDGSFSAVPELGQLNITALLRDRHSNLWVGTSEGLFKVSTNGVDRTTVEELPILSLLEDKWGALWVGTARGLERYRDAPFITLGRDAGYEEASLLNILPRRAGGLWVLDAKGSIWVETSKNRRKVEGIDAVAGKGMLGLAETKDGSLWVAEATLNQLKQGKWTSYEHPGGGFSVLLPESVGILVAQTNGDGRSQLLKFSDGQFYPVPVKASMLHVQRLYRDTKQRLWISTGGTGLIRIDQGREHVFSSKEGLPHDVVYDLVEDVDGAIWVATRAGIAKIVGDVVFSFAKTAGAPTLAPLHINLDRLGHFWISADDGVYRIARDELNAVAQGRKSSLNSSVLSTRDGLATVEFSWRCSAQAEMPNGHIYYATARGLAILSPEKSKSSASSPAVQVELARISNREFINPEHITLANRKDNLELSYTSPHLDDSAALSFSYKLLGHHADWIDAGEQQSAHFSNLAPGSYSFVVRTKLGDNDFGLPSHPLTIVVPPLWYETQLARVSGLLALLFAAYGLYQIQIARSKKNEAILKAKVDSRTAELQQEIAERQAAQSQIAQLAEKLEQRVEQRTAELELAHLAVRRSEERFTLAVRGAEDGLWDWDLTGQFVYLSTRWKEMLGYEDEALISSLDTWLALAHPDDLPDLQAALTITSDHSGQIRHEYRMLHKSGQIVWVLTRGAIVFDSQRSPLRAAGSQTDITPRKIAEEAWHRSSTHDVLTGLPNRSLFADRLNQAILRADSVAHGFAVLFLGIDRFKSINDSLGHSVGDQLLITFADRCRRILRPVDTLARLGGDEFGILLDELPNQAYPTEVADKLKSVISAPYQVDAHSVELAASMGIKLSTTDRQSLDEFLREAALALNSAKTESPGHHKIFEPGLRKQAEQRQHVEEGLKRALAEGELVLHYQPLLTLASRKIESVEALIRWNHPERGLVGPGQFLSVAEACGLMIPITHWVITAACKQAKIWSHLLCDQVRIAVNLPPIVLSEPGLGELIQTQLAAHHISASALGIEIVENNLLESNAQVLRNMNNLRELGIKIAIDDFGTGYSSFGYLKNLPVDYLKIDRTFTQKIPTDATDTAICRALLDMAKQLNLVTVVEGVENAQQFDFLLQNGCKTVQGYYFCPPLPEDACTAFLNDRESRMPQDFSPASTRAFVHLKAASESSASERTPSSHFKPK